MSLLMVRIIRRAGRAVVLLSDYAGMLAAGGQEVHMRKIDGDWYVTKRVCTWVS